MCFSPVQFPPRSPLQWSRSTATPPRSRSSSSRRTTRYIPHLLQPHHTVKLRKQLPTQKNHPDPADLQQPSEPDRRSGEWRNIYFFHLLNFPPMWIFSDLRHRDGLQRHFPWLALGPGRGAGRPRGGGRGQDAGGFIQTNFVGGGVHTIFFSRGGEEYLKICSTPKMALGEGILFPFVGEG